ncbi:flavin reductase family protein [Planosporangium thailandense]|uniref:Flavin reductase family protein n=1 Tax=Planosporangium thailandense TaxID=765197 RepID=A0ABX0XW92_9ACTN|nr:flavin reductase family protein [Planosporangium thailandense]
MTVGASAAVEGAAFRAALRHHAGGVAVVTVAGPEGPRGFTVTSLTAASLHPPLLSFYLNADSGSWPAIRAADYVGVHLLGAAHRELAALFARPGVDKFAPPTRWRPGRGGVPLLADATVRMVCARREAVPVGDHFIVLGEVVDVEHNGPGGDPLLYAHGEFGRWVPIGDAPGMPIDELGLADLAEW